MVQKTKKQTALDHIKIAHYALELIKARVQYEYSEGDTLKEGLENITAKIRKVRWALDEIIVEM